jgi:8-oxo-dGTP pyrophosphatase MutT (NUDIX family)
VADNGFRLKKLVNRSTNAVRLWEIPKGHKHSGAELSVLCAARELYEETGLKKSTYTIIPGLEKKYTYIDAGVVYNNHYYGALYHHHSDTIHKFHSQSNGEVAERQWMTLADIKVLGLPKRLVMFIAALFKEVRARTA